MELASNIATIVAPTIALIAVIVGGLLWRGERSKRKKQILETLEMLGKMREENESIILKLNNPKVPPALMPQLAMSIRLQYLINLLLIHFVHSHMPPSPLPRWLSTLDPLPNIIVEQSEQVS